MMDNIFLGFLCSVLAKDCYLDTGQSLTDNTVPDAVLIQFDLPMISTVLLEICRGL